MDKESKVKGKIISIILGLFVIAQSNAQIITDRPDQTESSKVVGLGNLQIESGLLLGFEGDKEISSRQMLLPTNLFRYGITNNIELRLLSQYETQKIADKSLQGISDLQIGTKIQLLSGNNRNTEIAFLSHLILPTGTQELSADSYGIINKISISHSITENIGIGYNLGYDNFDQGNGNLTYSVALGISVNDKVGVYIEPYGQLEDMNDYVSNFDAGFTYLANKDLQFDFSFGTGINQKMNYLSVGCSWLLHKQNRGS